MKKRLIASLLALMLLLGVLSGCGKGTADEAAAQPSATPRAALVKGGSAPEPRAEAAAAPAPEETAAPADTSARRDGFTIVPSAASQLSYTGFDNGLVSMTIPSGWQVQTLGSYVFYALRVYDPSEPDRQFLISLKLEGALKSQAAHDWYVNNYGETDYFAKMPVIDPQNAEGFFRCMNSVCDLNNSSAFSFPYMYDFSVIENLGASFFGGDLLRASYRSADGGDVEGLFTATVRDPGSNYVNEVAWDMSSPTVDIGYLIVYSTILMTAPAGEFNDWQGVLDGIFASLRFSDAFMSGYAQEQQQTMDTFNSIRQTCNEISDSIMDSWNARSASYDVMSQKQSDATLGFDRVYDPATDSVYCVYSGFLDDYTDTGFQPVTDDMYTRAVDGYVYR